MLFSTRFARALIALAPVVTIAAVAASPAVAAEASNLR